jgi:hypothetical protein
MVGEALIWRKGSRSGGGSNGSNCVEVATVPGRVLVRDSKDPDGGRLDVTAGAWTAFLAGCGGR